ncbi:hypothetical protein GCM10009754_30700 [Amycolatopsis minnesotensis]|uniref:Uncharacterized protein n=1 Tax=Amycolatopsis minnesotensis TaxID=337894 RepID=A0ABN2QUD6_9PSEU
MRQIASLRRAATIWARLRAPARRSAKDIGVPPLLLRAQDPTVPDPLEYRAGATRAKTSAGRVSRENWENEWNREKARRALSRVRIGTARAGG